MNNKILLFAIALLLCGSFVQAVDSTDPSKYFFYDDMETAANFNKFYVKSYPASLGGYNSTWAASGSYGLSINRSSGNDGTFYINQTEFSEYAEPFCIAFAYSYTVNPIANQEAGISFTAFAKAFVDIKTDSINGNYSLVDGTTWNAVAIANQGNNTWTNLQLCMLSGYAGSGNTVVRFYQNGVYKSNISTLPRNSLNRINLHNFRNNNVASYDNLRIWNYTKYGDIPPQQTQDPVALINKTPADISSTNIINNHPTWWYNYSSVNLSNKFFNYSVTDITRSCIIVYNGTCNLSNATAVQIQPIENSTGTTNRTNYRYETDENDIFPATYPLNPAIFATTVHNNVTLVGTGTGNYVSTELLNVSNATPFNFLEVQASSLVNGALTRIYACNSSYNFATAVTTSTNCVNFNNINTTTSDHNDGNSSHTVVSLPINGGNISTVRVTSTMYFLVRGASGSSNVGVIPTTTRQSTTKSTTNNGASWTNETYTVDLHLHQYNSGVTGTILSYNACGNYSGTLSCSTIGQDNLDFTNIAPSPPQIISIVGGENFTKFINITYTAAAPVGTATISGYNLTLINIDQSLNFTITSLSSSQLNYTWNTFNSNLSIGQYAIKVTAVDSNGLTASDISNPFNITKNGEVNFTASLYNGSTLSTFTINIIGGNNSQAANTTTGNISFYIIKGLNYTANFNISTYTTATANIVFNNISNQYKFVAYLSNTLNISIYDELTRSLINTTTFIQLIGSSQQYNFSTSTGNAFLEVIAPDIYNVIFSNPNYFSRNYIVGVFPQTFQPINAYLLNSTNNNNALVTFLVTDTSGLPLENVLVNIESLRNTTYVVTESRYTDISGQARLSLDSTTFYRITFSKNNYVSKVSQIQPSSTSYTIRLSNTDTNTFTSLSDSATFILLPINTTISNQSSTTFSIITTSVGGQISYFGLSDGIAMQNITASPTGGTAFINVNTSGLSGTSLTIYYWIKTLNNSLYEITKTYYISNGTFYSNGTIAYSPLEMNTDLGTGGKIIFGVGIILFVLLALGTFLPGFALGFVGVGLIIVMLIIGLFPVWLGVIFASLVGMAVFVKER